MDTGKHTHIPTLVARVLAHIGPPVIVARDAMRHELKRRKHVRELLCASPKYPAITVAPTSGHPEVLLREVCQGLADHGVPTEEISEFVTEALSDDYGHMLVTIAQWVVVDA